MNYNQLYYGDNLLILRDHVKDESVDLIYLDPPFNSSKKYKVSSDNQDSDASLAFSDSFGWDEQVEIDFQDTLSLGFTPLTEFLESLRTILKPGGKLAYLTMIARRIFELRRILKVTGSIYLHCDQRISAYIRVLMDALFGPENYLNHIVWCYGLGGSSHRYWPRKHDDILWYSRSQNAHYFEPAMIPATSQMMKGQLKKTPDYWYIPTINNMAKERTGYPTQKPLQLLKLIVQSSSPDGGLVLDPFCGSGTTLIAAQSLNRNWVGIDNSANAIEHTRNRISALSPEKPVQYRYDETETTILSGGCYSDHSKDAT